jgi:hypothetical protein
VHWRVGELSFLQARLRRAPADRVASEGAARHEPNSKKVKSMMKSTLLLSTALGLAMVVAGPAANAKNVPGFMSRGASNAHFQPNHSLVPGKTAFKAKLIAQYERGFATFSYYKGVSAISNPSTGVYCITPEVSGNLATARPTVTLEWDWSSGFAFIDFWTNGSDHVKSGTS